MARNPILVACAVGAVLNFLNVPAIPALSPALDLLGDAALPLGLIVAGAGLSFPYVAARKATVGAVAAVRPDLVHLLRGTARPLELRTSAERAGS